MKELFIGQFRVDTDRGVIVHQDDTVILEPEVLSVFLLLVERPNEIITHQEILDTVWAGVVVEANTLQRCIAQLRKAFRDDAKQQKIIATHPRVGYSLVADLSWQSESRTKNNAFIKRGVVLLAILLAVVVVAWPYIKQDNSALSFAHVTPLTTTDAVEYRPVFSPDGRYVAFQRSSEEHKGNLWLKDLSNNNEYLLTKNDGHYGEHSWSPDGDKLAFSLEVKDVGVSSLLHHRATYA
ncbi:MAG: DNA-binding winged helix-turn-helix (wHTH) protein [Flavobacteriales bacterium]|jgi:DNA-binding winged helix-turn-helix (wHTH) protein